MRCDEVQPLQGAYLDSELDPRASLEIEQHLKGCPECNRIFVEAQRFEAWLKSGLNRRQPPSFCWEKTEQAVRRTCPPVGQNETSKAQLPEWKSVRIFFAERLSATWNRSPLAWTALAATWLVILCLNTIAKEGSPRILAQQTSPSTSELRFALKQKARLMAELMFFSSDQSLPNQTKASPARPRSEWHRNTLNT